MIKNIDKWNKWAEKQEAKKENKKMENKKEKRYYYLMDIKYYKQKIKETKDILRQSDINFENAKKDLIYYETELQKIRDWWEQTDGDKK